MFQLGKGEEKKIQEGSKILLGILCSLEWFTLRRRNLRGKECNLKEHMSHSSYQQDKESGM